MEKYSTIIFIILFSSFSYSQNQNDSSNSYISQAPTEDQINAAALAETQAQLANPDKRQELLINNPQAQKADSFSRDIMGQNTEDLYKTASDFLPYIFKMGQGDPKKMAEYLNQVARDPASFAKSLPTDLSQKITVISQKAKPLPEERKP